MNVNKVAGENAVVILHNLRSAHNVGAIFRTADGAGVSKIYLIGTTPSPIDRFGRQQPDIAKTALGAENTTPWEYRENSEDLLQELKRQGFTVASIEQSSSPVDHRKLSRDKKYAFIFGNEVEGVPHDVLAQSDAIAEIPMCGKKESLNVAVAAGIILFR